jgi:hypothetical protein
LEEEVVAVAVVAVAVVVVGLREFFVQYRDRGLSCGFDRGLCVD